jgi:hypothetical protein
LFFGGVAFPNRMPAKMRMANCHLRLEWGSRAAPPKNKKNNLGHPVTINRSPLRGFKPSEHVAGMWIGIGLYYILSKNPSKDVGNDKR